LPGPTIGDVFELTRKSCDTWPTLCTMNVTVPGLAIDLVDSLKKDSPALTWTVEVAAVACRLA